MAAKQDYFGPGDYLVLLIFALVVFAIVIFHILTLGRPDRTLRPSRANHRQGGATAGALQRRLESPNLKGTPINSLSAIGDTVSAHTVGYLQRVDMLALRTCAQGSGCRIALAVVPGYFITPGRALGGPDFVLPETTPGTTSKPDWTTRESLLGGRQNQQRLDSSESARDQEKAQGRESRSFMSPKRHPSVAHFNNH